MFLQIFNAIKAVTNIRLAEILTETFCSGKVYTVTLIDSIVLTWNPRVGLKRSTVTRPSEGQKLDGSKRPCVRTKQFLGIKLYKNTVEIHYCKIINEL